MRREHAETIDRTKIYSDLPNEKGYLLGDIAYDEDGNKCIFLEVDGNTAFAYATGLINPATKKFVCQGTTANDSRKVLSVGAVPADLSSTAADGKYIWIIAETGAGQYTSIDNRGSVRGAYEQLIPASHSTTVSCQELVSATISIDTAATVQLAYANKGGCVCFTAGTAGNTYAYVRLQNARL